MTACSTIVGIVGAVLGFVTAALAALRVNEWVYDDLDGFVGELLGAYSTLIFAAAGAVAGYYLGTWIA